MNSFRELPLLAALQHSIDAAGFSEPTPIQAATLPAILGGRDVIAQAPTGSGKTAAFGLGVLQRLDADRVETQALVLCPTRELAGQVAGQLRRLAIGIPNVKLTQLTGGVAISSQLASLTHAPHIVVGTPGRVHDLLRRQALDPAAIRLLVLDEADRMLDMGFEETLRAILGKLPRERQSLLFSATWPASIRALGRSALRDDALEVAVEPVATQPKVEQWFHEIAADDRVSASARLLLVHRPESTVVFCNTKRDVDALVIAFTNMGFACAALHGDLDQRDRDEVLVRFANRSLTVLVASDVAARGLDVQELACVMNYELPGDPDVYLHRVGRTARAGHIGLALSLVTPREMTRALQLETHHGIRLRWVPVPSLQPGQSEVPRATMVTLCIEGGRADKLRPGDILGALTGSIGLDAGMIGKIDIFPTRTYVAVQSRHADRAVTGLRNNPIKGRRFRVRRL